LKYLAPGVWRLRERPRPLINVYLAEDVLIDAGRRWDRRRILAELNGVEISMLALTHVHPDHQGLAKEVCEARGVPLACHADDVDAMEGRRAVRATSHPMAKLFGRLWQGPPHKVDRVLEEGDEVAGFRVIHAPGHAPGEVILWRESDRVAICGDVIRNISYLTLRRARRAAGRADAGSGREPPLDPQAGRARPGADPAGPRPRRDRHCRFRALRRRPPLARRAPGYRSFAAAAGLPDFDEAMSRTRREPRCPC
jgi:hydroxyacylglutathione hydrolase